MGVFLCVITDIVRGKSLTCITLFFVCFFLLDTEVNNVDLTQSSAPFKTQCPSDRIDEKYIIRSWACAVIERSCKTADTG